MASENRDVELTSCLEKLLQFLKFPCDFKLRNKQADCLSSMFTKRDFLAVLPTGYGKSLVFQSAPYLCALRDGQDPTTTNNIVLVLTPLNSIMLDQCKKLSSKGLRACALNYQASAAWSVDHQQELELYGIGPCTLEAGELITEVATEDIPAYNIIYSHPEALLTTRGRTVLKAIRKQVCAVAVDEAHMILEWGQEFRTDFLRIGTNVLPLLPQCPVMVFTATAPPKQQVELIENLHLNDPRIITENPDRPNIKYYKIQRLPSEKTKDHLDEILYPICQKLKQEKTAFDQTILYTDTSTIAYCYWYMETNLGIEQYVGDAKPENRLFQQFHAEYPEQMRNFIVSEICKKNSRTRLVFATIALGMGLDAPYIKHIVHYKPPTCLEKYFQETGRAGRDGSQATATLYYNNTDIRSNRPGMKKEMTDYCKTSKTCLREKMLSYFGFTASHDRDRFLCCNICSKETVH